MGHTLSELRQGSNWTGEAAEAFTEGLSRHLPGRLIDAGEAALGLHQVLDEYATRYDRAKLMTWALEERAGHSRQALANAEAALEAAQRSQGLSVTPAFMAAGPPWGLPEADAVNRASAELADVLHEARSYRERFVFKAWGRIPDALWLR